MRLFLVIWFSNNVGFFCYDLFFSCHWISALPWTVPRPPCRTWPVVLQPPVRQLQQPLSSRPLPPAPRSSIRKVIGTRTLRLSLIRLTGDCRLTRNNSIRWIPGRGNDKMLSMVRQIASAIFMTPLKIFVTFIIFFKVHKVWKSHHISNRLLCLIDFYTRLSRDVGNKRKSLYPKK